MPLKCCSEMWIKLWCSKKTKRDGDYVSVYKLPEEKLQPEERNKWITAIPRSNFKISKYTAICRKHWPEDAPFTLYRGKLRPAVPPSIFVGIPASCCLSQAPPSRKTFASSHVSSSVRNTLPDELEQDLLVIDEISAKLSSVG